MQSCINKPFMCILLHQLWIQEYDFNNIYIFSNDKVNQIIIFSDAGNLAHYIW